MKKTILIVSLLATSTLFAESLVVPGVSFENKFTTAEDGDGRFQRKQEKMLTKIEAKSTNLETYKECVETATDVTGLRQCKAEYKERKHNRP